MKAAEIIDLVIKNCEIRVNYTTDGRWEGRFEYIIVPYADCRRKVEEYLRRNDE